MTHLNFEETLCMSIHMDQVSCSIMTAFVCTRKSSDFIPQPAEEEFDFHEIHVILKHKHDEQSEGMYVAHQNNDF